MQPYTPLFIPPEPIRIFTYNLLYPQKRAQHGNARSNPIGYEYSPRRKLILENSEKRIRAAFEQISQCRADILCLQEMTDWSVQAFIQQFPLFEGHFVKHPENFHGVALFFLRHKFRPLNSYSHQTHSRSHLIFDLMAQNQKVMRIASCHLRDPRDYERAEKSGQISKILDDMKPKMNEGYRISASVIAGDFNQDQWGDKPKTGKNPRKPQTPDVAHASMFYPLRVLGYQTDGDYSPSEFKREPLETGERNPYDPNYYQRRIVHKKRKIDYVWIRMQTEGAPQVIFPEKQLVGASDHAPVGSMFNL